MLDGANATVDGVESAMDEIQDAVSENHGTSVPGMVVKKSRKQ